MSIQAFCTACMCSLSGPVRLCTSPMWTLATGFGQQLDGMSHMGGGGVVSTFKPYLSGKASLAKVKFSLLQSPAPV